MALKTEEVAIESVHWIADQLFYRRIKRKSPLIPFIFSPVEAKKAMKIWMGILLVGAMLALSGCFDMPSVYPLYTDQTAVAEPRLVGAWQTKDGKEQMFVKLTGDREYRLTYLDDRGEASLWELRVVKLGETSVADMMAVKDDAGYSCASFPGAVLRRRGAESVVPGFESVAGEGGQRGSGLRAWQERRGGVDGADGVAHRVPQEEPRGRDEEGRRSGVSCLEVSGFEFVQADRHLRYSEHADLVPREPYRIPLRENI